MADTNDSTVDELVKYVPIFTGIFLLLEASKIVHYYYLWNFDIVPYLTISFVLTQFLGDISTVVVLIILFLGLSFIMHVGRTLSKQGRKSNTLHY